MRADYFQSGDHAIVNDTGDRCVICEQRPVGLAMFYVVVDEDGGRRRVIQHTRLRPAPPVQHMKGSH